MTGRDRQLIAVAEPTPVMLQHSRPAEAIFEQRDERRSKL
jgi:hypothetical protein